MRPKVSLKIRFLSLFTRRKDFNQCDDGDDDDFEDNDGDDDLTCWR